jgi:hypothetical protein
MNRGRQSSVHCKPSMSESELRIESQEAETPTTSAGPARPAPARPGPSRGAPKHPVHEHWEEVGEVVNNRRKAKCKYGCTQPVTDRMNIRVRHTGEEHALLHVSCHKMQNV